MSRLSALAYAEEVEDSSCPHHSLCQSAHIDQYRVKQMAHEVPIRPPHSESYRNAIHELPYRLEPEKVFQKQKQKQKQDKKKKKTKDTERIPKSPGQEPVKLSVALDGYLDCDEDLDVILGQSPDPHVTT